MTGPRIERLSGDDMTLLAAEASGARMQFAAIVVLDGTPSLPELRSLLDTRIVEVPRLRQRLLRVPRGRPIWVDDAAFELDRHVQAVPCPAPGNRAALLAVAAGLAELRLSLARSPWRLTLVTGLEHGRAALVIELHHVMADGLAGLAILSRLIDGSGSPRNAAPIRQPTPQPTPAQLRADRAGRRRVALRRLPALPGRLRAAAAELFRGGSAGAPVCSINAGPVGPRRAYAVAAADLRPLTELALAAGATVNDVALTAVTGGLRGLLAERGERPDRLVVSIPISARPRAAATDLGNRVGVLPVSLPLAGSSRERLPKVAAITRARKTSNPGASVVLYGPFVRALAGVGAFGWFIGHQRLINTFVTNVRGPSDPLSFAGHRIDEIVPVSPISGNVGVAVAVLGYAGRLTVTVIADADRFPDVDRLAALVQGELDALSRAAGSSGQAPQATG